MSHVVVIGCGAVGAAIAYELSQIKGLSITVLDKQPPALAATGAALGVLMGAISHKVKGNAWKMRETSIKRYDTLVPELEALTGHKIPFNRQGILMLLPRKGGFCTNVICEPQQLSAKTAPTPGDEDQDIAKWQELAEIRRSQGWQLEIWDIDRVKSNCPQIDCEHLAAAIYSPQDRQVDPVALTLALVEAAQRNGVNFQFGVTVDEIATRQIQTTAGQINFDWLVVAAGLGSSQLLASATPRVNIKPVLGQALHIKLQHPIENQDFSPVITGEDVHIVPVGNGEYWVGATVEFPTDGDVVVAAAEKLEAVWDKALAFCPALARATVIKTWSGLRPRPEGRPAPIIGNLPGYSNVLLATGHYRNGILLAPATARTICEAVVKSGR